MNKCMGGRQKKKKKHERERAKFSIPSPLRISDGVNLNKKIEYEIIVLNVLVPKILFENNMRIRQIDYATNFHVSEHHFRYKIDED